MDADPDSLPNAVFGPLATFSFTEDAGEVFEPETFAELEEYVDGVVAETEGSVSIAAMKDGKLVYEHAGGSAGIDSLLRVYPEKGISIAVMGSAVGYGSGAILDFTYDLIR